MAKHYLSVIALLLAAASASQASTPSLSTIGNGQGEITPLPIARAGDTLYRIPDKAVVSAASHEAMEQSISAMLQGKEEALASRYLTNFTEPAETPAPNRFTTLNMSLQQCPSSGRMQQAPRAAFHIPGDSLVLITKDFSINGSLYSSPVVAKQDGDSIALYNVYGWGSMDGYRAPRAFVADNGEITIPAQLIVNHATYGEIWIAPMQQKQDGSLVYSFDPIKGQMDAQGNITVGGWGIFVPAGDKKNTLFNAFANSEWKPANATYRSLYANKDGYATGYALLEQTGPGEIALYNVAGGEYGEVLYARLNANKTAFISPQKIFFNALLGDFYCYPASYSADGKATVDMKGNIQLSATDTSLNLAPWAITARGASNYAAAFYLNTVINTGWRPQWPEAHTPSFAGNGTQASPYKLASANDFAVLAETINAGDQAYAKAYYELAADIDWNTLTYPFQPIGTEVFPFMGCLDGKNHTISNFTYNGRGFMQTALFGTTGLNSQISNLKMTGVNVKGGGRYTSSLIGQSWSALDNVHIQGSINSTGECVGGIVATSSAPINNCSFDGDGTSGGSWGGIAGDAFASITRSHAKVDIAAVGYISTLYKYLGGISGTAMYSGNVNLPVEISDCYVEGTITDRLGYANVGGITSTLANGATIKRCFNTATLSAKRIESSDTDNPCAGIAGWAREGSITDCYNAGTIMKSGNSDMVAGIVGYLSVGYVYSTGSSTRMEYMCYVSNCYNSGQITSSAATADKGVFGSTYYKEGFDPIGTCISNCYSDSQVMGLRGSQYDRPTAVFTAQQLLPDFDAGIWKSQAGYYPVLRNLADSPAARLSSVAITMADGESASKMKSTASLSQADGVIWKLYDNGTFADATSALALSGSSLTIKDQYANAILVAMIDNGATMRLYRLAVVPKAFEGDGSEQNPYLIRSVADMRKLNQAIGTYQQPHEGDYFRLTADLDFIAVSDFIGIGAGYTPAIGFGGTFDGQNHTLHNLNIRAVGYESDGKATTQGSYPYSGLFNNILPAGTVRNLNIAADCHFDHWGPGGSIAGYNMGTIENCKNYAAQTAITDYLGGIVGYNTGKLSNCYNAGDLTLGRVYAGGIAGANTGVIEMCQNDADVTGAQFNAYITSTTQNSLGGIAGATATDRAEINSCLNQGTITAARQLGGIVGASTSCRMTGNINTGLIAKWGTDATQGAIAGNVSTLEGSANYYDASVVVCQAAMSSGRPGFNGISTAQLISGTAPADLPNASVWTFSQNAYPVLKAFASESASKTLSRMYVAFGDNETRANVQRAIELSAAQEVTYALTGEENSLFSLAEGKLNVIPAQGTTIGRDTLTLTAGSLVRQLPLQTVPVIFQGAGTAQNPYELRTVDDINRLSEFMYATGFDYANTCFKVMNDITFAETDTISPIAKGGVHQFNGIFDGNGKTISGFTYENTSITNTAAKPHPMGYAGRYMGFFGKIGSMGQVKNLTLNGKMSLYSYLGGIAGDVYGLVENCHVGSELTTASSGYVGGIASRLYSGAIIRDCSFTGTIVSKATVNGGIAAYVYADALVENCTMNGSLTATTTNGGIVGNLYGIVRGCKTLKDATFSVTSTNAGIVAVMYTTASVEDCENFADITCANTTGTDFAGIISKTTTKANNVVIRRCVNHGNITSKSYTGGVLSRLYPGNSLEDCVNYGTITSTGASQTGGITADTNTASEEFPSSISGCVNYGEIHGFASYIGGVAGDLDTECIMDSCFNYGNIFTQATSSHLAVGGVAGVVRGTMTRCLNAGNISAVGHGTGGICGLIQAGTVDQCANVGNVYTTGQFPASNRNGMVGGIVGYTVTKSAIYNSYNTGDLTGPVNMGGLIGRAAASASTPDIPLENCYTFGKLTITGEDEDAVSGNLFVRNTGVNVNWVNIYYNGDVNEIPYRYDPSGRARNAFEMQTVELGDAYTYSRAMLPRLSWLVGNNAADMAAVEIAYTNPGDSKSAINDIFYIGRPGEGYTYELSPQFRMSVSEPGKVYPVQLGAGTIKVSDPEGKYHRTFNLTVTKTTGADEFGIEAPVAVDTQYFDMQGMRISKPAAGACCIVRTIYSDGSVVTLKQIMR